MFGRITSYMRNKILLQYIKLMSYNVHDVDVDRATLA